MIKRGLLLFLLAWSAAFAEKVPRTIVLLYDGTEYGDLWYTNVHQFLATPLEFLGAKARYWDISEGWPDIKDDPDVIGVAVWNLPSIKGENSAPYLDWALDTAKAGKRFVFFSIPEWGHQSYDEEAKDKAERFWKLLGLKNTGEWIEGTYNVRFIHQDPKIVGFERKYIGIKPPYTEFKIVSDETVSYLTVKKGENPESEATLVAAGPRGGIVADDYGIYLRHTKEKEFRRWYINPFNFLKFAFSLEDLPKPDVTTLAGRRIYYSHIDGDGWNSLTEVEKLSDERMISAEVIAQKIIVPNPDLPVTVAPIAADLDPEWAGMEASQESARKIFALKQVEPASHTYSHPFDWGFFKDYSPKDEEPYLDEYTYGNWNEKGLWGTLVSFIEDEDGERRKKIEAEFHYAKKLSEGYSIPRAFANFPFDIHREIQGSLAYINQFTPKDKKAALVQWSGNCQPFFEALKLTKEAGARNINGGDTRFDSEFGSYAWVRPLYRPVKDLMQIYASMSNENTYTDLWTDRFYAYRRLPYTLYNTETPIRLRPINLYYHMYSGEKLASLNALLQNVSYIKSQKIAPIRASLYPGIVKGFYALEIDKIGGEQWRVAARGELQTVRFDNAVLKTVDFAGSKGVVGLRHLHGSLYVYLDEAVEPATIALKEQPRYWEEEVAGEPYLLEGRWRLWNLQKEKGGWRFSAQGYGEGEMAWRVPEDGEYIITAGKSSFDAKAVQNSLEFVIRKNAADPIEVSIRKK